MQTIDGNNDQFTRLYSRPRTRKESHTGAQTRSEENGSRNLRSSIDIDEDGNLIAEFSLRCESGTYVKETVHGDGGRTQPSVASLIKAKCTVEWLDVADIHAD